MKSITRRLLLTALIGASLPSLYCLTPYQAITIVPVADLLGDAAQNITSQKNISPCYNQLPLCSQKAPACSRLHQLLFNEIVTVIEEKNDEVRIIVPNLFFETAGTTKKNSTYWALKKNFVSLEILKKNNIHAAMLPQPIQYDDTKIVKIQPRMTLTLLLPHHDEQTNHTFSVGTRFVIKNNNVTNVSVYVLNADASKITTMLIPKKITLVENKNQTQEERIKTFLTLIKVWAHPKQGFIPYVWGGCSYTHTCLHDAFTKKPSSLNTYHRENYCKGVTKTGFDCTGLLARAAQAAGMPYYFKNSTTILHHLKELTPKDSPESGDIIWLPGHIMIISDAKKNLVIEARSYDHGWGKIHEAHIRAIFKNANTLKELLEMCSANTPLERIDRDGLVAQKILQCKILSLRSIWQ